MAKVKITKRLVDTLRPSEKAFAIYDAELKGFGVRVMPSGVSSYIVEYRPNGGGRGVSKKRMVIGRVGEVTPEQARRAAQSRLAEVRHGDDPLRDRQTRRKELRVTDLIDHWEAENPRGRRTGKPMATLTRKYTLARLRHHAVPILGTKRVNDVQSDDINYLIDCVSKGATGVQGPSVNKRGRIRVTGGAGAARKVCSDLSIVFAFAVERQIIVTNPVTGARKPRAGKRHDFLLPSQMSSMSAALDEMEAEGANLSGLTILRLLILTGARPSEIETLKWSEVDFAAQCLRLSNTKTGHSQRPLSAHAIALLRGTPRIHAADFVFPATRGTGSYTGAKKLWNKARTRAGLDSLVRYHARHAMASLALAAGHDLISVSAIMGHSNPRTTLSTYAHVLHEPAKRAADSIGSAIALAMKSDVGDRK